MAPVQFYQILTSNPTNPKNGKGNKFKSKVAVDHLYMESTQKAEVRELLEKNNPHYFDLRYTADNQEGAQAFLKLHGLAHNISHTQSLSKWTCVWSRALKEAKQSLFQCQCGHMGKPTKKQEETQRRLAYPYTQCLAHVEVTEEISSRMILRIQGFTEHNEACQKSQIERPPTFPLHSSVFDVALQQMDLGASLTAIQEHNRRMVQNKAYPGQADLEKDPHAAYRWLLSTHDTTSLYRQHSMRLGVNLREKPEINMHEWLDMNSPNYKPHLAASIFHYTPRTTSEDRLEICISTSEMKEAAWKHGHGKQILLDGTFGVCTKRILLFIAMAVDDNHRGVPLAFMLFSAPTGNQLTAAGYNTDILEKLLRAWKTSVNDYHLNLETPRTEFRPLVAITDTDLKERGALTRVFNGIHLLICRFHLSQSWHNSMSKKLRGKNPVLAELRQRVVKMQTALIQTTNHSDAIQILKNEEAEFLRIINIPGYSEFVPKALDHLAYLEKHWLPKTLWQSWSEFGRVVAAAITGIDINRILPTTNHLEAFNAILKRKHLVRWSRGGRRIREDSLIALIITKVLPGIFEQRRLEKVEQERLNTAVRSLPGGSAVVLHGNARLAKDCVGAIAYLEQDEARDAAAQALFYQRRISEPYVQQSGVAFTCLSASLDSTASYRVWLGYDSTGSCTCADFGSRGGACKHMRCGLVAIKYWETWAQNHGQHNHPILTMPAILLPQNRMSAIQLNEERTPVPTSNHTGLLPTTLAQATQCVDSSVVLHAQFCEIEINGEESESEGSSQSESEQYSDDESEDWAFGTSNRINKFEQTTSRSGVAEQAFARGKHEMNKLAVILDTLDSTIDILQREELSGTNYRAEYEQHLYRLNLHSARVSTFVSQPEIPSSDLQATPTQRSYINSFNKRPRALSPEQRQVRKTSRSIH